MKIFGNFQTTHNNFEQMFLKNKGKKLWSTIDFQHSSQEDSAKKISIITPKFYVSGLNVNSCRKMHVNLDTDNNDFRKLNIFYNKKLISSYSLPYK